MNADTILPSIVKISQQRDQDSLEDCLLSALLDCVDNSAVLFHRIDTIFESEAPNFTCSVVISNDNGISTSEFDENNMPPAPVLECKSTGKPVESVGEHSALYFYPISSHDKVISVIEMHSDVFTDTDKQIIDTLAKVYENLLQLINDSTRDTLTGLLNRRTFEVRVNDLIANYYDENLEKEEAFTERRNTDEQLPHWLAVIDIDFFKKINDKFGHIYGDEVLLLLSQMMKRYFRKSDLVYRFGGEEFVVVIRPSTQEDAIQVFERLREEIETYDFPQVGRVTISTGIAEISKNDYPTTVLDYADKALYYAKENGRNKVCCYEQLIKNNELPATEEKDDIELF